jgi:hypothetical protein
MWLLVVEEPLVTGFIEGFDSAPGAPAVAGFRGNMVLGSNGSWLATAPATEDERVLMVAPLAEESGALPAVVPDGCSNPVDPVPVDPVTAWLMLMSWSSWLSEIIWPTIAVESMGAVGSWFCNSVANRFRKVLPIPVDEVPAFVPVVGAVPAFAFTALLTTLTAGGCSAFKTAGKV